jgi:hypothetical protein
MLVLLNKPHCCAFTQPKQSTEHRKTCNRSAYTIQSLSNILKATQQDYDNESCTTITYEQITLPVLGIDILSAYGEIT